MNHSLRNLAAASLLLGLPAVALADTFVAIGEGAKVFDEPNAKGYVTLNMANQEVAPLPGMAFKVMDDSPGWYLIEYSPGLRGYLSKQTVAKSSAPKEGTYAVSNAKTVKVTVVKNGDAWTLTTGGNTFKGKDFDGVIVFNGQDGNPAYTLTDTGSGTIVMSYDNAVTKFL